MIRRIAQAWAFASILLLPNYADISSGDTRMHVPVPITRIVLAQLTDMAIVTLVFLGLMAGLRRLRAWPQIRWGLMALLPPLLLARNLNVMPFNVPGIAVLALGVAWTALLILLVLRFGNAAVKLRQAGSSLLAGFAIFALVMTAQLGRAAFWRPGPQAFSSPIAAASPGRPRVVWILFDELAYKPVFAARDPSLQLPEFDRLRAESTLYTDVTPIGYKTEKVVPSLLLGRIVTATAYEADNRLLIRTVEDPDWERFDADATLFGMAKRHRLTTSLVGWYMPACPMFAGIATDCYWSNDDAQDRGPTMLSASFAENVWFPLRIMVEKAVAPGQAWDDTARWSAEAHIESVKDISQHALATLASSQADIVYLHLPTPHPPAFWNRQTGTYAVGGSYLDSLAYSDQLLGKILDILQAQPRWASTTLIVHGDHSWRTKMWRPVPGWSAEDERISHGGQWDPRPLLMIHTPGQDNPGTVSEPTSLVLVHDTVAAYIRASSR